MDSDFCENIDEDYQRSTYNAILNSPILPVHEKNRIFTYDGYVPNYSRKPWSCH